MTFSEAFEPDIQAAGQAVVVVAHKSQLYSPLPDVTLFSPAEHRPVDHCNELLVCVQEPDDTMQGYNDLCVIFSEAPITMAFLHGDSMHV